MTSIRKITEPEIIEIQDNLPYVEFPLDLLSPGSKNRSPTFSWNGFTRTLNRNPHIGIVNVDMYRIPKNFIGRPNGIKEAIDDAVNIILDELESRSLYIGTNGAFVACVDRGFSRIGLGVLDTKPLPTPKVNINECVSQINEYKKSISNHITNMVSEYLNGLKYKPSQVEIDCIPITQLGTQGTYAFTVNTKVTL